MAKSAVSKLKVFAIVWWGYSYAFRNIPLMFRAGWPLFMVTVLFYLAGFMAAFPDGSSIFHGVAQISSWLIFPLGSHFAVAWHRSVLLGEMKPKIFRLGRPEISYFLVSLLFFVFIKSSSWIESMFQGAPFTSLASQIFLLVLVTTIILATPILPALAISDRAMTVLTIWRQLCGNWIRFIIVAILLTISASAAFWIANKVSFPSDTILWWAFHLEIGNFGQARFDVFRVALAELPRSLFLGAITIVLLSAQLGALSIVYAGIVRRTLASKANYAAVDRLADRLTV
ncbi:MAG: hypothetical protein H8E94_05815 [Alphaproteobacteria bacterium]|nr:hypothetical protein [Alphaproteobacteria bacterium]